jgi:hypothetical protein
MFSTQELIAFANAASSISQAQIKLSNQLPDSATAHAHAQAQAQQRVSMIQLSNQLRDSSTAHTHMQVQQRVAAAAPVPVPVPAAAALLESDYSQRRIKFKDHANEVRGHQCARHDRLSTRAHAWLARSRDRERIASESVAVDASLIGIATLVTCLSC